MQNSTDVKAKIEQATTTIASVATTSSAVVEPSGLPEAGDYAALEKILEKAKIPDNWELIAGEMDKLNPEDSQEIVVFQNKACKPDSATSVATTAQQKSDKEKQGKDFIQYMFVYRAKPVYQTARGPMETSDRPICLTLCYENLPEGSKFTPLKGEGCYGKQLNLYCRGIFPVSHILTELKKAPPTAHIPSKLSCMHDFVHFRMGLMKKHDVVELFDALVARGIFSKNEGIFIISLFVCRPPSKKEVSTIKLWVEVEALIKEKLYDRCIEIVKKFHADAIEENKRKYYFLFSELYNDTKIPYFLDDELLAFGLGEALTSCSSEHACLAFNILTEHSPLYPLAQQRIKEISADLTTKVNDKSEKNKYLIRSMGASLNSMMSLSAEERASLSHCQIETIIRYGEIDPNTRIATSLNLGDIVSVLVHELHKKSVRIRELSASASNGSIKMVGSNSVSAGKASVPTTTSLSPRTKPLTFTPPTLNTRHSDANPSHKRQSL